MMKHCLILLLFAVPFLLSCHNTERKEKTADPVNTYYDYQIWAEEGTNDATIRLQYKEGGEEGEALALDKGAKVLFDNTGLRVDSSRFTGAYYELLKPVAELAGPHAILLVDEAGKEYRETFTFTPFALASEIPEEVKRKPFRIRLKNFPDTPTTIRLVITDTSLQSADVNDEMLVRNGTIHVTEQQLANLTNGPATLEIYREEEWPIHNDSGAGGKFLITYGIKREFELVE